MEGESETERDILDRQRTIGRLSVELCECGHIKCDITATINSRVATH